MTMTDNNYEDNDNKKIRWFIHGFFFLPGLKFNSVIQGCMVDGEGELRLPPSKES